MSFGKSVIALHQKTLSGSNDMDKLDKKINELLEARIASLTQQLEDEKGVLDKIGDLFGCATSHRSSACSRELQKCINTLEDRRREHDETIRHISNELQALLNAQDDGYPKKGGKTIKSCTKKCNKSKKRTCRRTKIRGRIRTFRFG
jgi:chaperonin cofactor prefoldin